MRLHRTLHHTAWVLLTPIIAFVLYLALSQRQPEPVTDPVPEILEAIARE